MDGDFKLELGTVKGGGEAEVAQWQMTMQRKGECCTESLGPSATCSIQPPASFEFSREWVRWIKGFKRFCTASNLNASSDANEINTLIYCMGDEVDDILRGLTPSEEQKSTYQGVCETFQNFFIVKKTYL